MNASLFFEILDGMADAVIVVGGDHRVSLFNKGAEKIFGYTSDEMMGQRLEMLLPEGFRSNHHKHVDTFSRQPQQASKFMSDRGEIKGQRKDGEVFHAEASISKVESDGKVVFTAVLRDVTERKKAEEKLKHSYIEGITSLVNAAENHDDETGGHVKRIGHYTKELATAMGMDKEFCNMIFHASSMHDIGKIGIPDRVLLKPGALNQEEWEIMKTHPSIGGNILKDGFSPYLQMGREIAIGHHERWDGSGYPNGIKGEETPISARIMQIADVYDALRSERPYKPAFEHAKALSVICDGDGRTDPSHFDPRVLAAFNACSDKLNEIYENLK
ncbi:PAS domain S-box protein [Mariprofundus sp. NF]|uniref:HD domain-containing phosphohydrolase n=1 Tax=Mariprofundus sp. NF TaxID=2608716 RepID=UPI0015A3B917|nr:HD domain-containing phosphohydrolase [Mariprofundus sp. NF]NWF37764.1 PAS domain S-box protein [Mariprofundus sp. NF]